VDDGKTGILFDPDDPQDLYRAATELLMNPELRREIGERARQVILREKNWPVVGAAYGRVYRYATENCSARVCRKKAPV
jgi:glycosyltransferase involved in cell wall biosynthesis